VARGVVGDGVAVEVVGDGVAQGWLVTAAAGGRVARKMRVSSP